ncbi:uroporphyrinogen-III C-methyltransferase [Limosilactobacillus sp. STM2_1]|uniref:Uroporphyrinogen-III C-methyltransferase n=1 Tax=Limosilactobacillus rudii TaxID=2759755 RepID=A0A7W3YNH0_9LACO|nr:uroporphyrinogen-III C-methyltransferase [Limosilactobacillus rudii]MBB1079425.1 uroporphyrinogen-III C-methyltransferase [Limosilactobacillus rudii]MBB1097471.1 uroporphyrinogen-III C-methyltransferase [Limosilactobacillus rudii]MCD7134580.1 uroporphyrinogen-III C-methyltransferase [Limosilactobacillus rudii]
MNGRVSLLGAGPGNPELLTLIGKRRLNEADVVLYDRLIDPSLLAFTNEKATLIDVGKMPLHHKVKQSKINEMLVSYARSEKKVVRLKAGDPYVFGRGGEEAQILKKEGIDFEIIPGITSAIAGLAAAGIPITHRDFASSFHVITGHHKKDGQQLDWNNIASQEGTLVFLMGMAQLSNICQQLIKYGKDKKTPVAIIQWATQWRQKMVIGDLSNIVELVNKKGLSSPALIVVGNVVRLSEQLNVTRPLKKVHVLVPYSQRQRLFNMLGDLGATADFYQRTTVKSIPVKLPNLDSYSAILFDDFIAYKKFVQLLLDCGQDLRALVGKKILVGNDSIAKQLHNQGLLVDEVITDKKSTGHLLEIGGQYPMYEDTEFLSLYHRQQVKSLLFDLTEFNAVIFPSTVSLMDFKSALNHKQVGQLKNIIAFAMGKSIGDIAKRMNFKKVINCRPNINATIEQVKEEFAGD